MDLLDAARCCRLREVQALIQQGADVNTVNRGGQSALFFACENGHYDVAEFLLKSGALVNHRAKPLITAVRNVHANCVDLLLKHGANVYSRNMKGETAMSVAVQNMNVSVILLLIDHGARPHVPLECLFSCAKAEDAEMLRTMLNSGSLSIKSDECLVAAFQFAFKHRSLELAADLMSRHSGSNLQQVYPLAVYYSARNNWCDILTELLKKGVDVNVMIESCTPLYAACEQHAEDAVALLLQNGADPDLLCQTHEGRKETALHVTCSTDDSRHDGPVKQNAGSVNSGQNVQVVKLLVKHGANFNALCNEGETALYRACKSRQVDVVQLLLDAGADVNLTTSHAYPLIAVCTVDHKPVGFIGHLARFGSASVRDRDDVEKAQISSSDKCHSSVVAVIRLLLESGADVNSKCPTGDTALHRAIRSGLTDAVRLLLEVGADVGDYTESSTEHPLYLACSQGSAQMLDLLLQHSTESNFSSLLTNLLGVAVEKGFIDVADVVIKHGADVSKAVISGQSVFLYALKHFNSISDKSLQLLRLLVEAGADVNESTFYGQAALHIACRCGSLEMLQLLLQHGANCSKTTSDGKTALVVAYERRNLAAVELLLKSGADPNVKVLHTHHSYVSRYQPVHISGVPLLILAVRSGDDTVIKMLLQYGAEVNWRNENGNTVLHDATTSAVTKALVDAGADVNAVNGMGETPLLCATRKRDADSVEALLKAGANVFSAASLCEACERNDRKVVKLLLAYGADTNALSRQLIYGVGGVGQLPLSPLCIACKNGNADIVIDLLEKGASTKFAGGTNGETALHFAVKHIETLSPNPSPVVSILIDYGASVNAMSEHNETPLYAACERGLTGVVRQLTESNADVNVSNCKCPLLVACERSCREIVSILLNNGANVNVKYDGRSPLIVAAEKTDGKLVEELLNRGAESSLMDNCGNTALHAAVLTMRNGTLSSDDLTSTITTLLNHGANLNAVNGDGETSLYLACSCSRNIEPRYNVVEQLMKVMKSETDLNLIPTAKQLSKRFLPYSSRVLAFVKTLLSLGADPNLTTNAKYPLIIACERGHHDIVKLLLEHGADVQATDEDNKTPLYHALKLESHHSDPDLSTVNLLLDCGADTNTVTTSGKSPLYIACSKGLTALVQRMLKCGTKVNTSKDQKSPLIAACKNEHLAVVELLLTEGADPNVPEETADGCSFALHFAAARHNSDLVNLLLKHGANVHVMDASGNTAVHHVVRSCWSSSALKRSGGHKVVLDTLLEAGADVNICNSNGESLLYLIVEKGLMADVSDMLSYGANPNLTTADKFPLCVACETQNFPLVQTLLKAGAYPNLTADSDGEVVMKCQLPLCIAAEKGNLKLAELLLNSGATVNMLNWLGKSALHLAVENLSHCYDNTYSGWQKAENKTPELVKLLLDHGADVNKSMPDGRSPLSLLLNFAESNFLFSFSHFILYKEVVSEAVKMMISNGANLADSSSNLRDDFMPRELRIIESLCAWRPTDHVVVDLLKAGAGFQLLALFCGSVESAVGGFHGAKSVRVCQSAIMAGYVPSSDELAEMQQSVSGEDLIPQHVELLSWLNEDRQQAPTLMRQCRVAIRRQLSVASCHRTILSAINQLPLPSRLQLYLKFEGDLTEIDLSDEALLAEELHIMEEGAWNDLDDDYGYDTVRDIVSDYDSD